MTKLLSRMGIELDGLVSLENILAAEDNSKVGRLVAKDLINSDDIERKTRFPILSGNLKN